jgi:hypothetical protein
LGKITNSWGRDLGAADRLRTLRPLSDKPTIVVAGKFTINLGNAERIGGLSRLVRSKAYPMSRLSFRLAKAVSDGRAERGRPSSREQILSRLLMKRAMAHQAGLIDLEAALRGQIAWALPVRNGEEAEDSEVGEPSCDGEAHAMLDGDAQALDDRL